MMTLARPALLAPCATRGNNSSIATISWSKKQVEATRAGLLRMAAAGGHRGGGGSGGGHGGNRGGGSKADLDNHANQLNPNNPNYGGGSTKYGGDGSKQDLDNHSNQLNPNNPNYDSDGDDSELEGCRR